GAAVVSRTLKVGKESTAAVDVGPPCACGEQAIDVPNLVACGAGHNDDDMLDFSPELFNGFTNGAPIPLPCGRLYVPKVVGTGTLTLLVASRTVLFVAGDIVSTGSLTIKTSGSGELDLFVEGSLRATGGYQLSNSDHPERVRIFLGGSAPLTLGGTSQ